MAPRIRCLLLAFGTILTVCLAVGCGPAARPGAPAASSSPARPAATVSGAPSAAAAAPAAASASSPASRPTLVTTPMVDLKVGVLPSVSFAPEYIAQARGYFQEVGLNVEFFKTANVNEQLPAITRGQLHVGTC